MSETSSFYTSVTQDAEDFPFRWIIHGSIVIPTGNPFLSSIPTEPETDVQWLGPGLKLCRNHIVAVDNDGVIMHIGHESTLNVMDLSYRRRRYIRLAPNEFLCPGFVDLHIHAPQYAYTGTATDRPLMGQDGWLETYTFPAEESLKQDLPMARRVYERVVRKTLSSGTTTATYFATLDLEPCKLLVDIALRLGQRALVGKVCMDRHSPENYVQTTKQNIDETIQLIDYIRQQAGEHGERPLVPLVLPIITPRFIPTCTPELLTALAKLAAERKCHVQSHISESIDEVAFTKSLQSTDKTDAEIFDSYSLLSEQCIMAHGVHLSESDLQLMKERGAAVAHCPLSNFFFAGGTLPCRRLMENNNRIGLGTDVAGGYSPSMLHSARMAVLASHTYSHQHGDSPNEGRIDFRHAFYLATLGGAEALGLSDKFGTFKPGMEFDAIILSASSNIDIFLTDDIADVFQKILNLGDDRNVKRVFVQGKQVMEAGNILYEI
jgi:guanine deaminase